MELGQILNNIHNKLENQFGKIAEQIPVIEIKQGFEVIAQQCINKLNLVPREEFEIQTKILAATRAKLEELEDKVAALEANKLMK